MVEKYSDLPSDAETGTTIGVKEDSLVYRYDGSKWVDIYEINLNPISEVDDRLSSQLAETDSKIDSANIRSIEPLNIYTFDGTFQPYHPSVLYFGDVRWNGYKFWIVQTPFPIGVPPYRDRWECPSILASDDGINWDTPHGAPVPLVDLTQEQIDRKDYFSDPCLVMNGSTMEVWYRHTNGADIRFTNVYRMTSEDGFTWSEPEIVLDVADNNNGFLPIEYMRSQQIFYENGTYTAFLRTNNNETIRAETNNPSTGVWTNMQEISFDVNHYIWHLGMYKDDGVYHMTAYDSNYEAIRYYTSVDGVNFKYIDTILTADGDNETSDYYGLYQAVPVKVKKEWLLYTSATIKNPRPSSQPRRRAIVLYAGKDLTEITHVRGGRIRKRNFYEVSPHLNNEYGNNSNSQLYYGTYYSRERELTSGYKMNFGKTDDDHTPVWFNKNKNYPIPIIRSHGQKPVLIPSNLGVFWFNSLTEEYYISTGTE